MCWPNTIRNIQLSTSTVATDDLAQLGATGHKYIGAENSG